MLDEMHCVLLSIFAANLRNARQFRGLSQRAVSRAAGGDEKVCSNVEREAHVPTLQTVERLAKAVRFAPWQLLLHGFDPAKPPKIAGAETETRVEPGARNEFGAALLAVWDRLLPGARAELVQRALELEGQSGHGPPAHPPAASQASR